MLSDVKEQGKMVDITKLIDSNKIGEITLGDVDISKTEDLGQNKQDANGGGNITYNINANIHIHQVPATPNKKKRSRPRSTKTRFRATTADSKDFRHSRHSKNLGYSSTYSKSFYNAKNGKKARPMTASVDFGAQRRNKRYRGKKGEHFSSKFTNCCF